MITLDGKPLKDFGLVALKGHDNPATPTFDKNVINIPGRSKAWVFKDEIGEREINIPLFLNENNPNKLNEFIMLFYDEYGQKRDVKLTFNYEPDNFYTVELLSQITPERAINMNRFDLSLVAYDPYKYSNVYADEITWGSEAITFEYHYLLGHESTGGTVSITKSQTLDISVDGLAVQPIFEIEGTANNLTINANGHEFTLPNFINTKWVIDFEKYLVYKDGQETMEEIRDFYLMPGNNKVNITGSNINLDMRIKFRDKYN